MTQSVNSFAFELYKTHYMSAYYQKQRSDNNVLISPLSASSAMAIAASGSSENTQEQLRTALGLREYSLSGVEQYYQKLQKTLPLIDSKAEYVSANSLWISNDFSVKPTFLTVSKEYSGANIETVGSNRCI